MSGIYGVGYNSGGKYSTMSKEDGISGGRSRAYVVWRSILMRCYSNKHHTTHKNGRTYEKSYVCETWKDFQIFAEWFYSNYTEGFDIDKDILVEGNEEYSPHTCVFVPKVINSLFKKKIKTKSGLPLGVYKGSEDYTISSALSERFGVPLHYSTVREAESMHKYLKAVRIRQAIEQYKVDLNSKLIDRLYQICDSLLL